MENRILKRHPLGNPRFIWKQKEYVISTFSGFPQSGTEIGDRAVVADRYAKYHKEAGFNMMELGWVKHEGSWAAVEACEKNGMNLVFQDLSLLGGMDLHNMDREVSRERIFDVVNKLKDKKYTIGYYVWDEPHTEEQLAEARRQMDILQEAAPEALLFTVAQPDYNLGLDGKPCDTWESGKYPVYIKRFIEVMDPPVLSFDYYPVGDYFDAWPGHKYDPAHQLDDSFMLLSMALHRDLAAKHKLPFWFYYQGFKLYKCTKEEDFTFPMVRCFMYAAVLYGAKGLQNYATGQKGNRFMNPDGTKGDFYEDQKKINFEIKALGNTLMALDSKLIIHSEDLLPGCPYTEPFFNSVDDSDIFAAALPKRTSVGELEDDYGNRYAVILNRDFEKELDAVLPLKDAYRIYEVSKEDGKQRVMAESADALSIRLAPGDAVLLRIQKASEPAYTVEYVLE